MPNPILGVFFHWLGGLAAGSFYLPFRGVRRWAWETYWLAGGLFSWIVAPWALALLLTPDPLAVLLHAKPAVLAECYVYGALWGIGGLTFGLTMRYLGLSLGMAVALGYCAALGTLVPPIRDGEFTTKILGTHSGLAVLVGVGVCLVGIAIAGLAGMSKERELSAEARQAVIREFDLRKGLLMGTVSGILSACFSFGLAAGGPIKAAAVAHGCPPLWQGLPVLIVVLLGGITTNGLWCLALHRRNGTGREYFRSSAGNPAEGPVPVARNWCFSALAGVTWYFQFFFYSMGESQMGAYGFSSWTLHMASIILFSTLWGIALHEWRGTSPRTRRLVGAGLALLVVSTLIVGYGNYLAASSATPQSSSPAPARQ